MRASWGARLSVDVILSGRSIQTSHHRVGFTMSAVVCSNPTCRRSFPTVPPPQSVMCPTCGNDPRRSIGYRRYNHRSPSPLMRATLPLPGPGADSDRRPRTGAGRSVRNRGEARGAGAFGTVYRAYDPQLDREVALKVARAEAVGTPDRRSRFLREAKAAANSRHPNVVPVYDSGQDGERLLHCVGTHRRPHIAVGTRRGGRQPPRFRTRDDRRTALRRMR